MGVVFVEPDWDASIDFKARLAAIPPNATVRGMFLQVLVQGLSADLAASVRSNRYIAFKKYPLREYVELLALSCSDRNSLIPHADRVRRLGRAIYPTYAKTLSGTAIFAVAGTSYQRVLELCPAAYRLAVEPSVVTIRSITHGHAVVELRDLWNLPDLHQVGIFEGAARVCKAGSTIRVQALDFGNADLEITWQDDPKRS